jgi:ribonuclease HI
MIIIDECALNIFTDGSSYPHPRRGGLGARFVWVNKLGKEEKWDYSPIGYIMATNNQMELQACIDVLKIILSVNTPINIDSVNKIIIYTDSLYVVENWERALFEWSRSHWLTRDERPVQNASLWRDLVKLRLKVKKRVYMKWVKGHKDNEHNKAADKLAKISAHYIGRQHLSVVNVRRKISNNPTIANSVKMEGQKITIRIIDDEFLRIQKIFRYRYEVMSKKSKYYQKVDFTFSEIMLSAGHTYYVQFNNNQKSPEIIKLFKEIKK